MSILDNLIAAIRPQSEPTPEPTDSHGRIRPQATLPESPFETAARRLTVLAAELLPIAATQRTGPASPSIAMQSLWAQAPLLLLEAQMGGTAEDKLAANAVKALSDAVHDAWMSATAPAAPAAIAPPAPVPAVDRGEHTLGRPHVGSLVHRFDSPNGKCHAATVVEVFAGAPSAGVAVTASDPYLALVDAESGGRVNARWIARPVQYTDPEPLGRYASWHRATEAECPR